MKHTKAFVVFLLGIFVVGAVVYATTSQDLEHFAGEAAGNTLVGVVKNVNKELDANATLYRCADIIGKGVVTTETSASDAEKFGRCSIIMDFKNRMFQKVKDIVGGVD